MPQTKIATIKVKCCDEKEAVCSINRDGGLLHFRCVYCGFEVHAGAEYQVRYTPEQGVQVFGSKESPYPADFWDRWR